MTVKDPAEAPRSTIDMALHELEIEVDKNEAMAEKLHETFQSVVFHGPAAQEDPSSTSNDGPGSDLQQRITRLARRLQAAHESMGRLISNSEL